MLFTDIISILITPSFLYIICFFIFVILVANNIVKISNIKRFNFVITLLIITFTVQLTPFYTNYIINNIENIYKLPSNIKNDKSSVIIILSSGYTKYKDNEIVAAMDKASWERLTTGIILWRKSGGYIIISGGTSATDKNISNIMKSYALEFGVPDEYIKTESSSLNTYENITNTLDLISANTGPVYLVTSALHMNRAMKVSELYRKNIIAYPCDFIGSSYITLYSLIPTISNIYNLKLLLHEVMGLFFYKLKYSINLL